jgi:hypothetical protein
MCNLNWMRCVPQQTFLTALVGLFVLACGESPDESVVPFVWTSDMGAAQDESVAIVQRDASPMADGVMARFRLIDPVTGRGVSDVTLSAGTQQSVTDNQGEASLPLPVGPYAVSMFKAGVREHTVFGVSAGMPFEQVTYFSSERITELVFGSLGIQDDPETGTVVVGLDLPSLAPAVGASASLSLASAAPFVLSQTGAVAGDTIGQGQLGFVSFPNTEVGAATISVTYPQGECAVFPAEAGASELVVTAGGVSIVAYTCR